MGYKRELLINNGSLTSYKKLLKVSEICQLLDKSKYRATQTINGATFTNNGDGTITVNSLNITSKAFYQLYRNPYFAAKKGHTYCVFSGANKDGGYFYVDIVNENGVWVAEMPDYPYKILKDNYSLCPIIYASLDKPLGDKIYKPQLFDLTEMYGAGNEPKTAAEFKAKFPNEMYDYSPRCWVKSYKTGLIAKTKNLFNINALTPYTPETLPNNTAGVYNGNIIARAGVDTSVCQSGKTLKQLCPDLVAGERYVLSYQTNATGGVQNIYLLEEDRLWQNGYSIIITETSLNSIVCFYANYPELTVATITNFQIEKGSTATDYIPYGYL